MIASLLPLALLAAPPSVEAGEDPLADLEAFQARVQAVVERVSPATVGLSAGGANGSGVIVSSDGLVLTAAHVIGEPGSEVKVKLPDGRELVGDALGSNPFRDSGMLRIRNATDLPFVEVPRPARRERGTWCLAIAHPGGYQAGRPPVPRIGRLFSEHGQFVQTDCPVIFGDSGGPLFDLDGQLIGIHSRILESVSVNYHVPMSTFRLNWEGLLDGESDSVSDAKLGVRGLERRDDPDDPEGFGVRLLRLLPGRAADEAGLEDGDVVCAVNGEWVDSPDQLRWYLADLRPEDEVTFSIDRGEEQLEIEVTLRGTSRGGDDR